MNIIESALYGQAINEIRLSHHWSVDRIAYALKSDPETIRRLCRGDMPETDKQAERRRSLITNTEAFLQSSLPSGRTPVGPITCTNGHPFTHESTIFQGNGQRRCRTCLQESQQRGQEARTLILQLRKQGMSNRGIAAILDVSDNTVGEWGRGGPMRSVVYLEQLAAL